MNAPSPPHRGAGRPGVLPGLAGSRRLRAYVLAVMLALAALALLFTAPAMATSEPDATATYKVEMTRINGDRSSVAGVQAADKVQVNPGSACDDVTVTVPADSDDSAILAAADAKSSCHSITTGSRYIDADGEVHNFQSGKRTYWLITRQSTTPPPTPAPTSTPGPTADYTVTHVEVDGARNSAQAVKDATKTATGVDSGHFEFTLDADAANAAILAAANALSTHSITTGSRYIDAGGEVHNFQSGKRTYWLITKSEVNVVAPTPTPEPQNVGANQLTLTGAIADQELSEGVLYTSATAFPVATGIDGTVTYSVANLPSGLSLNSDRELTGTPRSPLAVTEFTYKATDTDGDTATLTFNISVKLHKPENLTAIPGVGKVTLYWNSDVLLGWQVQTDGGAWTARIVPFVNQTVDNTRWTTVESLTAGEEHTFKVRVLRTLNPVRVIGDESDPVTSAAGIDYDDDGTGDGDGLIQVDTLAQLDAIRWDLDGDGDADESHMQAVYDAAFPYPLPNMGCPSTGCRGYELDNDLDFDTNGDGNTNTPGDTYWGDDRGNDSRGWQPIGDRRVPFTAVFDGNAYNIKNLYVYKNSTNLGGLFGRIAKGADIRSLNLVDGEVSGVAIAGSIAAEVFNGGEINYCDSNVNVSGKYGVGGLVGENWGSIKNSSATGAVTHTTSWGYAGGLAGRSMFDESIILNTFATGAVTGASTVHMGGLVGTNASASIRNSYSTGAVSAGRNTGGMVGSHAGFGNARITGSYWDTTASGRSDSAGGTGKTTTELKTPTSNTGIYTGWDTTEWDFGTSTEYPEHY